MILRSLSVSIASVCVVSRQHLCTVWQWQAGRHYFWRCGSDSRRPVRWSGSSQQAKAQHQSSRPFDFVCQRSFRIRIVLVPVPNSFTEEDSYSTTLASYADVINQYSGHCREMIYRELRYT